MKRKKITLWTAIGLCLFTLVVSSGGQAAACVAPNILFGRWRHCGYFYSQSDTDGGYVRLAGVPNSVNTVGTLSGMINADLGAPDTRKITESIFFYRVMTGQPVPTPPLPPFGNIWPLITQPMIDDFNARLASYGNLGENGSQSFGTNGRVDWFVNLHMACGTFNSYYQDDKHDIAPYIETAANSDCEVPGSTSVFIVIRDTAGNPIMYIRRLCMNPMGTIQPLSANPPANYDVYPYITTRVNGVVPVGSTAEAGDTVTFEFRATNAGTTPTASTSCSIYANRFTGYSAPPGTIPTSSNTPYTGSAAACPFTLNTSGYATYDTQLSFETLTNVAGNQTICRSLTVTPAKTDGSTRPVQSCIQVSSKPYTKVFGGDVAVGGGIADSAGSCSRNANASLVGWNAKNASYTGAGSQYAGFAMGSIFDFATAQSNNGAAAPAGLSFNNQVTAGNIAGGLFGGSFGSVPCAPDFYGQMPASASSSTLAGTVNVSSLINKPYSASSSLTLSGGNINPNTRPTVYVDGDVYISGDITNTGSWNVSSMPVFQLVARGNIYISPSVKRLDGVFIAQKTASGTKGIVYTCTNPAAGQQFTALPLDGNLFDMCKNETLVVNGAVVADRLMLLRTKGSLKQSVAGETRTSTTVGEIFNYNPAVWIAQPDYLGGKVDDYDAITSLPPVL